MFSSPAYGYDAVDNLISQTTPEILFALFSLTIARICYDESFVLATDEPLTPDEHAYATSFCYATSSYFVRIEDQIPLAGQRTNKIEYYPYVPGIILTQFLSFIIPIYIFSALASNDDGQVSNKTALKVSQKSGSALNNAQLAQQHFNRNPFKVFLVNYFDALSHSKMTGNYLLFKFMNLVLLVCHLIALDRIFWPNVSGSAFGHLINLMRGIRWNKTGLFPVETLCDFTYRSDGGNIVPITVQILLTANALYQPVLLFIFCLTFLMAAISFLNIAYWMISINCLRFNINFVKNRLPAQTATDAEISDFVRNFLRIDGITWFKLHNSNRGWLETFIEVEESWRRYKNPVISKTT